MAVEVTTSNPSPEREPSFPAGKEFWELDKNEILAITRRHRRELPIRMGSPLFSKLNKEYWKLPQCKNKPFVISIEAFHEKDSLFFTDSALLNYLYGIEHYPSWTYDGRLIVNENEVTEHKLGGKIIPSNFFRQETADYISAVIFSNSGTMPKFNRMGYQEGYNTEKVKMIRMGHCYDPNPNSATPLPFSHDLDERKSKETWGEGMVVFLNPQAKYPIPIGYFPDACHGYIEGGEFMANVPQFHPFASITNVYQIR